MESQILILSEVTVEKILATQPENCPDGFKRCFCIIRSARSITHRPLLLVFVGEPRQKIQQWRLNRFLGTSKVSRKCDDFLVCQDLNSQAGKRAFELQTDVTTWKKTFEFH
jgi:hypothetical protein